MATVRLPGGPSRPWRALSAIPLCLGLAASAAAQAPGPRFLVQIDNDYFDFTKDPQQRADDNYSHGVRLEWATAQRSALSRRLGCASRTRCSGFVAVAQAIYTPTREAADPIEGERPFAGWLGVTLGRREARAGYLRSLHATLGLTGPASLGEAAQRWLHSNVEGFREPIGWEHQLSNEVAFLVGASQRWFLSGRYAGVTFVAEPSVEIGLGTLRTFAAGGLRVRAGVGSGDPLWSEHETKAGLFVFAGLTEELIANDLFLDGNSYSRSVGVAPRRTVAIVDRGIGIRTSRLLIDFTLSSRTREYARARPWHTIGKLRLTLM